MERLTMKFPNGYLFKLPSRNDEKAQEEFIEKLSEKLGQYEDAEEQGLLHKAPLKDGTPIWYLLEGFDEGAYLAQTTYLYNVTEYEIGELGKNFWLSEEEAEQALAEMQKG